MGVLPSTLKSNALCVYFQMYSAVHHQILPKRLLQTDVKLIAVAGAQRRRRHASAARNQRLERRDHRIVASQARQHQVLVERSLHRPRIRRRSTVLVGLKL